MYAVVEIAGQQYKVKKGDQILAPKLEVNDGDIIELDKVLLTSDESDIKIGDPIVKNVKIKALKMNDERGKKVIVFKKKRRKGYKVKNGHRQDYTRIQSDDIVFEGVLENGS